jgi:hypothetical protein
LLVERYREKVEDMKVVAHLCGEHLLVHGSLVHYAMLRWFVPKVAVIRTLGKQSHRDKKL